LLIQSVGQGRGENKDGRWKIEDGSHGSYYPVGSESSRAAKAERGGKKQRRD
jgi:hypothetical protein